MSKTALEFIATAVRQFDKAHVDGTDMDCPSKKPRLSGMEDLGELPPDLRPAFVALSLARENAIKLQEEAQRAAAAATQVQGIFDAAAAEIYGKKPIIVCSDWLVGASNPPIATT